MRALATAAIVASVLTLSGCGGDGKLDAAYNECFGGDSELEPTAVSQGDDGESLIIDITDDAEPDTWDGVYCILDSLDVSDAIREDMASTTSQMGRQKDTEDGLTYRWSYHPDNGFKLTIR